MHTPNPGERKLTELDFTRLKKIAAHGGLSELDDILDEADVVPGQAVPAEVVTMYAQFVVVDLKLQRRQVLVVCYPSDAEPAKGYISVCSPAGLGLIGLRVGAIASWTGPGGEERQLQIEQILFQPEATGDYLT
jgi:regulator of nucleoside diphosphate kinase